MDLLDADHQAPPPRAGWYPDFVRCASPNCDSRPAGTQVDLLVIHAISLPPGVYGGPYITDLFMNRLQTTADPYFAQLSGLRVSAHFLIRRSGEILQFVALADRAWHAGLSRYEGRETCNDFSIGIEIEGCDEEPFESVQYASLIGLTRRLMRDSPGIAPERIVGHSDIAPGRKTDPGPCFDWALYRAALRI